MVCTEGKQLPWTHVSPGITVTAVHPDHWVTFHIHLLISNPMSVRNRQPVCAHITSCYIWTHDHTRNVTCSRRFVTLFKYPSQLQGRTTMYLPQYIGVQQDCCQTIKGHAPQDPHTSNCSRRSGYVEPTLRLCDARIGARPCNVQATTGVHSQTLTAAFACFIMH
jgi:hypothetical protein